MDELTRVKEGAAQKEHEFTRRIRLMDDVENQAKSLTTENANLTT
ncbi:MAG: hypothetical protein V2I33_23575 [Kangiellaceae bacterium]|jgi:hypothetical protein|nr:hypothetical protein [Kangiellaceae bacterium]